MPLPAGFVLEKTGTNLPEGFVMESDGVPLNVPTPQGPFVGGERPAPVSKVEQKGRKFLDYLAPLVEVPLSLASSIPAAVAYGNVPTGSSPEAYQQAEQRASKFQYVPQSPVSQQALESLGEGAKAIGLDKLPPYIPGATQLGTATKQAAQFSPIPSYAAAQAEKATPVIQSITQKTADLLKKEPKPFIPSSQQLENQATFLFDKAKESGVILDSDKFGNAMKNIAKDLRSEGYTPTAYPKVTSALEEMQNPNMVKDFTELKTLRKLVQSAQKSIDPEERRIATILKDKFDDYMANLPDEVIVGGAKNLSKEGIQAWKEARDTYSKMSKAEIFQDMLEKASMEKHKFTQSGEENSLFRQLRSLAENPKRMRMFTAEEQEAIKDAVKGGNVQNALRFMGRFVPSGPVSGMFAGGAILSNPILGGTFEAGALGSRLAATKIRKNQVNRLAELMRQSPNAVPEVNWQKPLTVDERIAEALKRFNQGE